MSITQVQSGGTTQDANASVSRAFGSNVTSGNLVYIVAAKYNANGGTTPDFSAANCTKSAGTATIGTVSLDSHATQGAGGPLAIAVWSALVTGSGSLTMQVAGGDGFSYWALATGELSATSGWDASRVEDTQTGSGNATTQTTANLTSSAGGAFVGGTTIDTGNNEASYAADAAFTQIYREPDGTAHAVALHEIRIASGALTDAVSTTTPGAHAYVAAGVVFKEVGGGGTATGTGAITLGAITVSGTGAVSRPGTGAVTLGAITVSGTAEREITDVGGSIDLVLPAITVSGSEGTDTETGTGAITLGAVTVSGTAEREIPGSGSITLGRITVAGTGSVARDATGAITLGALQVSGVGDNITTVTGTGAITLGAIGVSGFDVAPKSNTGAGRKRKRRYYVEIDGQEFEVSGPAAAESLLARAKDVAQAQVEKARASPVRIATGIKRPRIATASPELKAVVRQARKEIVSLYDGLQRDLEIASLMRAAEQEEEEAIIRLLM